MTFTPIAVSVTEPRRFVTSRLLSINIEKPSWKDKLGTGRGGQTEEKRCS